MGYFMDLPSTHDTLRASVGEYRYEHCLRVADTARKLALCFGCDTEAAYLAGLLHDCAKGLSDAEALALAAEAGIRANTAQLAIPRVMLHGQAGARLARTLYGVQDAAVLQAIARHQSAAADMTVLDNVVKLADIIEPARDSALTLEVRALAQTSLDEALLHWVRAKIPQLLAEGYYLENDYALYYNELLRRQEHARGIHPPAPPAQLPPVAFDVLVERARSVLNPRHISEAAEAGGVGAALLAADGNIYVGVCIDTACSMGFCAEHAAAAAMVTAGCSRVLRAVAVDWDGSILPPCGRCREFLSQLHDDNLRAEVLVAKDTIVRLADLLPYDWRTSQQNKAHV